MKNNSIMPGKVWLDTEGKRIQAHGGQVFYENGKYYWVGENKDHTLGEDETWAWGIRLYSSTDLYNWYDEGLIVEPDLENKNSILHPLRHLDRPHILFNEKTKKYVMWIKFCDEAHYAVLTSHNLKGKYEIVKSVYRPYGVNCGDFDIAKDDKTGDAYLYFDVNHTDLWGAKLSDDYTEVEGNYSVIYSGLKPPLTREAPAHFMRNGKHYIVTSGMTGYSPNPSEVVISDDWLTGYKVQGNPHVNDTSNTSFHSQISGVFKLHNKDFYIAIADRWLPNQVHLNYTGEFGVDPDLQSRLIKKLSDLKIDPTKQPEEAKKIAISLINNQNTSIADYVWLSVSFENDQVKIIWKDEWFVQ